MALTSSSPVHPDEHTTMISSHSTQQRDLPAIVATPPTSTPDTSLDSQCSDGAPSTTNSTMDQPTTAALEILRGVRGQLSLVTYSLRLRYPQNHPAVTLMAELHQSYITSVNTIHRQLQVSVSGQPQTSGLSATWYVPFRICFRTTFLLK